VKSVASRRFWDLFEGLPSPIQALARKNYRLWRRNPSHPSLHFRRLKGNGNLYTVRIGDHFRAFGRLDQDTITWLWIGSHAEYDRLV
jgi:hypothetical protein